MTIEELRTKLEDIIDPTLGITLKESDGIKHLGYDKENDVVTMILSIGKLGGDNETLLRRNVARVVKIDCKFKGLRLQVEESKIYGSITKKKVNFIGVVSGKGGVGKSSVAANIAYRLMKKGLHVGIIDADIYGSSIPTILEVPHRTPSYNEEKKILPIEKDGIEIISTEFFTDESQPVIWRGGMLNSMLSHFFYDIKWHDDTKFVIIDFPPGTGDVSLDIKNIVPQAKMLLVTTPHPSASHVAVKAGFALKTLGHELLGVIENMSYFINPLNQEKEYIFGAGGGEKVAEDLDTELIAKIPIAQPKYHQDIFEIDEENGKIFDMIADFIIYKCNDDEN